MNGPEHYLQAERLLGQDPRTLHTLSEAQVHATLALAAATAMGARDMPGEDFEAWDEACGVQEATDG